VHDSKTQIASHPFVQQLGSWLGAHTAAAHAPHAGSSGGPAEHTSHVAGMVVVVVVLVVVLRKGTRRSRSGSRPGFRRSVWSRC
jgi:hypothetical protein